MIECQICNKHVKLYHELSTHLKSHNISSKNYYDTYTHSTSDICVVCSYK